MMKGQLNSESASQDPVACVSPFQETMWGVVLNSSDQNSAVARQALEELCQIYWRPIYIYLRRRGKNPDDAQDITQAFFAFFLEKKLFQKADQSKGRLRFFLLGTLKHFLSNQQSKEAAEKRGGKVTFLRINPEGEESRFVPEPADPDGAMADREFDRRWAMTVLNQAMLQLEDTFRASGQEDLFQALRPYLTADAGPAYQELAQQLHKTEGAIRSAVYRLRQEYRQAVRNVISQTIENPQHLEMEFACLKAALRDGT